MCPTAHVQALAEWAAPSATARRGAMRHTADGEDAGCAALSTDLSRRLAQQLGGLDAQTSLRRKETHHV